MELAIPFDGHVVEENITPSQKKITPSYATTSFGLITFPEPIVLHFHQSWL
jgi:hypothetical protein